MNYDRSILRKTFRISALFLAWFAIPPQQIGAQQPVPKSDLYLWSFHYLKGDLIRVRTHIRVECRVNDRTLRSEIDQSNLDRIVSVNARGDATVTETVESCITSFGGEKVANDANMRQVLNLTLGAKGVVTRGTAQSAADIITVLWPMTMETPAPDTAVRVGESWRTPVPNSMVDGEYTPIVSTLAKRERSADTEILQVKAHASIHPGAGAGADNNDDIILNGHYNVDAVAGRLVHLEYTVSNVAVRGADGPAKMTVTVQRDYEKATEPPAPSK